VQGREDVMLSRLGTGGGQVCGVDCACGVGWDGMGCGWCTKAETMRDGWIGECGCEIGGWR